jgi:DNA polymerase-3 subunit gamma/tau
MSYQVIARKYRPQVFDEVVGQRLIMETLKNAILTNRVAHGYIFSGARGVGKTTTARILAKALNCFQGVTVTPCGECPSCQEIAAGNSVDVLEIDAASNRGIDEIRELRESVRYLPARDRYKVFIIDEAHMLTTEAFNALLKTLEEPPPRALFILATTEPHKLPATIQSRCQHFPFRLLDYAEIFARLQEVAEAETIQADEGALSALAQAAEGSLRDALSLLDQVIAACGEQLEESRVRQVLGAVPTPLLIGTLEAIHAGDARRVLEGVGRLAAEGYELAHFSGELTRWVRNLMVAKSCGVRTPLLQVPDHERAKLADLAQLFSEEDLARFFELLLRVDSEMRYSLQPRFHLELGLMKLVHARRLASLESLLGELRGTLLVGEGSALPQSGAPGAQRAPLPESPAATPRKAHEIEPPREGPRAPVVGESFPSASSGPRAKSSGALPRPEKAQEPALQTAGAGEAGAASAEDPRLSAIKALLFNQSKKFLSSCLEHLAGCRFEDGEVRFLFGPQDTLYADLLRSREQQETLRSVCAQVLGQPVKICVILQEQGVETQPERASVRQRAERDAGVEAFRQRFDGALVDVQDLSRE